MRIKMTLVIAFGLLAAVPRPSVAQSCLPFLAKKDNSVGGKVQLVTLNKNGIASSSQLDVAYRAAGKSPTGGVRPPQWYTDSTSGVGPRDTGKQLFSDRVSGPVGNNQQPFAVAKADLINVVLSVETSPQVTITLRSWGNSKATFRVTCSAGGVMHGSTADVDYLLFLAQSVVN